MTHHDGEEIVPGRDLRRRVQMGRVTRVTRYERAAEPGDTFELMGSTFEVTDVEERTVNDIDMGDIRSEHATSAERFLGRLQEFDGPFEVEEDTALYTLHFRRRPSVDPDED